MIRPAKESLRYSILLIILLATGALAVSATINYLDNAVPSASDRVLLTVVIWTLTLGFMLIAGAFGLWTIHFATEAESLRRISKLVDHMNDVRDAIIAIDRQGKMIGMNTAAETFFGKVRGHKLQEVCPAISEDDLQSFLTTENMIEREYPYSNNQITIKTLRFRVQPPVSGISLLLVSDITSVAVARKRQRQAATLHLAAHLAQGIANDFNDLLCGISGHASLLSKPDITSENLKNAADNIQKCADRGIWLARQLTQLSQVRQDHSATITVDLVRHIASGTDILTANLDPSWSVEQQLITSPPPVNVPPSLIEHVIHSLGLIIAETNHTTAGTLHITLRLPHANERLIHQSNIAAILEIKRKQDGEDIRGQQWDTQNPENGVVSSLVQTLIIQAGGQFEAIPDGRKAQLFRIYLPEVDPEALALETEDTEEPIAIGLEAYTAGWTILLCMSTQSNPRILPYLEDKNIRITVASNEDAFLQAIASNHPYEVIFIQPDLLGQHFDAILPIITRINPKAAVVLLTDHSSANPSDHVVILNPESSPSLWIHAMIEARSRIKQRSIPEISTESPA